MRVLIVLLMLFSLPLSAISYAEEDITTRFDRADVESGSLQALVCKACHSLEQGGENRIGPNLYAVINRDVATVNDFKYSPALKEYAGIWTLARLDSFLANPGQAVSGTAMTFTGIDDPQARADLMAYLNTLSDSPLPRSGKGDTANTASAPKNFGLLYVAEGVELTYYTCTACHSEMIVVQQGKTREGWDELLNWMIEEQGMGELSEDNRTQILDYLSQHYNTGRPNFPR